MPRSRSTRRSVSRNTSRKGRGVTRRRRSKSRSYRSKSRGSRSYRSRSNNSRRRKAGHSTSTKRTNSADVRRNLTRLYPKVRQQAEWDQPKYGYKFAGTKSDIIDAAEYMYNKPDVYGFNYEEALGEALYRSRIED